MLKTCQRQLGMKHSRHHHHGGQVRLLLGLYRKAAATVVHPRQDWQQHLGVLCHCWTFHSLHTTPDPLSPVAPGHMQLPRPRLAGISIPLERRREIYAICRQHDMVIIEDDPYFYLQWDLEVNIMDLSPNFRNSYVSTCGGRPAGTL